MRINTNISALQAYTNITKVNSKIDKSMNSLSSGYSLNSVKDNPSGMAISNKLRSQIRGLEASDRNAMDAISIIQTAEGALQEVHNMLQRINELAVQASSGTNTASDRQKMQSEIEQLLLEIDDTAHKTEFNGMKLLNGDAARLTEVAVGEAENVKCTYVSKNVDLGQVKYDIVSVGEPASVISTNANILDSLSGEIEINGERIFFDGSDNKDEAIEKIRDLCQRNNIEIAIENGGSWSSYANGINKIMLYTKEQGHSNAIDIKGDASLISAFGLAEGKTHGKDAVISNPTINGKAMNAVAKGNKIVLTGENAQTVELELGIKKGPEIDFTWKMKDGSSLNTYSAMGATIDILDFGTKKIQIGPEQDMALEMQIAKITSETLGLSNINIVSAQGAQKAIGIVADAVAKVSSARGELGAYQNRLEYTTNGINIMSINTNSSLSRIKDTDMAMEMTNLTQNNIITQAGIAILAQANQRPQQLLQLLN